MTSLSFDFSAHMIDAKPSAVREILKVTERPDIISFAGGLPAPELFPVQEMAAAHSDVFSNAGPAALQYSTTEGWRPLRQWIASHMTRLGVPAEPDRILITAGSQQGIDLVCRLFIDPGDVVVVEDPSYVAALQLFGLYGARFAAIPGDENGIQVDYLEEVLATQRPKLIYLVNDFQNPRGTTLSLDRRRRLIDIVNHYRVPVLEDDPYGELRYRGDRVPPLAALDREGLVFYISTFSKTLSPGIRVGWVLAPEASVSHLTIAKQATDLHTSTISQHAVAKLLETFDYQQHLQQTCEVYSERCETMLSALEEFMPKGTSWTRPEGGLFTWVKLPEAVNGDELLIDALEHKVAFVPGVHFFAADPKHNFIRLNFSNRAPEMIREGISRICQLLRQRLR